MADQQPVVFDDNGNPITASALFDDEGKPVASHEPPKESTLSERWQQLPGQLPRLLKEAALKAAGPGLFEDAAGAGATAGSLIGLGAAPATGGLSMLLPILGAAVGAGGGKVIDQLRAGGSVYPSDIAPRVAGETLMAVAPGAIMGSGKAVMNAAQGMARSAIKPTVSVGAGEAQRRFGSRAMGSEANDQIIRRGLERRMFGGPDPLGTVKQAQEDTVEELKQVIGDQPVDLTKVLPGPMRKARGLASRAAEDIPGAQAAVRAKAEALRQGLLGEDVTRPVISHVPSPILGPEGQPLMRVVTTPETTRQFRKTAPASEVWEAARGLDTKNNYEKPAKEIVQKMGKWTSGALREGVKEQVPEARPVLAKYADEAALLKMLANPANREANKNQVMRLPTMLAALSAVAKGNPAFLAAPLVANYADRTALQNSQRLFEAGRNSPRTAVIASGASTALREALLNLLNQSEEPQP